MSKFCPEGFQTQDTLRSEPIVRHPDTTCDRLALMPRSFATLAVPDRLPAWHMHRDEFPDARANMSPSLPVTTANASAP
jgi:hypothetical protein